MLSRVAAVKAPRTHNLCRVTGSSGRRREGGESEPQRPNMSRHLFCSAVLLLVTTMCCATCGATAAKENDGKSDLRSVEELQWVDLFVPQTTPVLPEGGGTPGTKRDAFVSPSLLSAGGVIAALAEGHTKNEYTADGKLIKPLSSAVVAGYIDSSWDWSTLVGKVSESTWKAYTVLDTTDGTNRVGDVFNPTTTTKGNKVFLLARSYDMLNESGNWKRDSPDLKLVVGDVTKPTASEPSGWITWGTPTSLGQTTLKTPKAGLNDFDSSGGSGVVMEDGTLVFPVSAFNTENVGFSMIIYSNDNGITWSLSEGMSPAKCETPRITEWEGSLLMIVDCDNGQRVYESRDMGTTWTEAIGTLPGVWVKPQSFLFDLSLRVDALITANIEGRKVMLYIQKRYASVEKKAIALYLWVTDNNRSFYFGPVAMDNAANSMFVSNLLYSDGALHILKERANDKGSVISLARLTEELKTIKSTLSTWSQLDASFSASSTPTAGLVGLLSNSASGDAWIDDYRSVNAKVMNAVKVHDGFKFTGFGSGAIWPVNNRESNGPHTFVNYNFTLVATVIVHKVPKNSTTLLGAVLAEPISTLFIGLSYGMDGTWETVFNGETTTSGSTWMPGKEYQVAIMLQDGNKGSVYVDGVSVGSLATLPKPEVRGAEIADFYFVGGEDEEDKKSSSVTVKNVFLYNRPLGADELRMVKKIDDSMHGSVSRALLLLLGLWGIAALY
ncbi:trans-sialidase [Trypanosoma cruzi cruzi]|uniref:Putative trans-sialidase, Group II n=3 Tax=Trypanosoma cruzi TaxID=5693 RepID=A0A2V2UXB7_TRYCR|nr:trans-sialidase [Trypanosoma cruzi cruzi]PWU86893.1 putative trans-sialidase, Group II [Trypanosoma cruzi]